MNILKKMLNSHSMNSEMEVSSLSYGQLYLVRSPSSPKSENECLYNEVFATITKTPNSFHYQLKISKVQEAEQETNDDDEDDDEDEDDLEELLSGNDEWTFLIDESLKFCLFETSDGKRIITWKDVHGDAGDMFEFRLDKSVADEDIQQFMIYVYKCEFERKYRKSSDGASSSQLSEFVLDRKLSFKNEAYSSEDLVSTKAPPPPIDDLSSEDEPEFLDANDGSSTDSINLSNKISKGKVVYEDNRVSLYLYVPQIGRYELQQNDASIKVSALGDWDYSLSVSVNGTGKSVVETYLFQDMNAQFNPELQMFLFNCFLNNSILTWAVKFESNEKLFEFQKPFIYSLYESVSKQKYGSTSKADEDYLAESFDSMRICDDDDIQEVNSDEDEEGDLKYYSGSEPDSEDSEEEEATKKKKSLSFGKKKGKVTKKSEALFVGSDDDSDYDSYENTTKRSFLQTKESNKGLNVGFKTDRTFVARGNKLGIFKTDDDSGLELYTTIENIKSSKDKKKLINPNKMMLHQEDRYMVLQDDQNLNRLYKMDLEVGKVVEDWDMASKDGNNLNVVQFGPSKKYAQLTNDQLFNGLSSQGVFNIDPRLNTNSKVVEDNLKSYKTKTNFSSISTTNNGNVVIGSSNGEIRLYDRIGVNAKTQLPSLGDGIIGLDTSNDGRYVLATTKKYLLLLDTKIHDGKNVNSLGFMKSFDKDKKPIPRRLQLLPHHIAFIKQETGKDVDFTVAHFDTEMDSKVPTSIVSATGPYAIRWSLKKILKGDPEPYLIKKYSDTVNADNFRFNNRNDIIVSLADDVSIFNRKSLKKATRETLLSESKR